MYTGFVSPTHVLPEELQMPTLKDPIGGGAFALQRQWPRALRRWELTIPADRDKLDPFIGFLEQVQGDVPFWFDGGGMIDVIEPILIAVTNGTQTEFQLPHRHVFVSSAVFYLNSTLYTTWTPLGDGIVMDSFVCDSAPAANGQLTAIYKRKAKVILETEEMGQRQRAFRDPTNEARSSYYATVVLQEIAID